MKYSKDERVGKLVRELLLKGAVLEPKKRGSHACLRFPNGHKLPIPKTPSDWRSGLNWTSHVKTLVAQGAFDVRKASSPE